MRYTTEFSPHELAFGLYLNRGRTELRQGVSVKIGIQESLARVASLSFLQAIFRSDDEAQAEHERQQVVAALDSRNTPEQDTT